MRYVKRNWIRFANSLAGIVVFMLVESTFADARLEAADQNYRAGQYARAATLYRELARGGKADAQLRLGMLYYLGRGVPEDEQRAFEWIERSAKQGNRDAQFRLATLYTLRQGIPKTAEDADVAAARWYFSAASSGHAEAQYTLALMFITGKGVQQNAVEADKWMRRAAAQGFEAAVRFSGDGPGRPTQRK